MERQDTVISPPVFEPFARGLCSEDDAPVALRGEQSGHHPSLPGYMHGLPPQARRPVIGYESTVIALQIVVFLVVSVNLRHYPMFVRTFIRDLVSMKRRSSLFDVPNVSEVRIILSMVLVSCVCQGTLVYTYVSAATGLYSIGMLFALIGIAGGFYLFQLGAFSLVGYVFEAMEERIAWIRAMNAQQTLLGMVLLLPTIIALFNSHTASWMMLVGMGCYVITRAIFVLKGIRLFFNKFTTILYFILYLCALETVPVMLLMKLRMVLSL